MSRRKARPGKSQAGTLTATEAESETINQQEQKKGETVSTESDAQSNELENSAGNSMCTAEDESPLGKHTSAEGNALEVEAEEELVASPYEFRNEPRVAAHVKAVVQFKESEQDAWKEIVDIRTISKNGAALYLSRPCPVGRIVTMALQMPTELRVYDFTQEIYAMLGVVQNCSQTTIDGQVVYQVGVAFIGKKLPESYKADPTQSYRMTGRSPLGLWTITEAERGFVNRKAARFWRKFEVSLSMRDTVNRETKRQKALTRDVSRGGMSVWGPLDARIGDRVKVTSRDHDFFGMAVVRNRTESDEGPEKSMVHFEFDGVEFPVTKINVPKPGEENND